MTRPSYWPAGATALLLAAGLVRIVQVAAGLGVTSGSAKWIVLFTVWGAALAAAAAAWLLPVLRIGERRFSRSAELWAGITLPKPFAAALSAVFAGALPILALAPLPEPLGTLLLDFWVRAVVFWIAALAGTLALTRAYPQAEFKTLLLGVILVFALVHRVAVFLPEISTVPFSLGWSEGSRYYYASLFFSKRIYGMDLPPSVLHPTRYLMQAVPFLLDGLPLWFHRFWQVGLWLAANGLAAWALVRRPGLAIPAGRIGILVAAWAFLFLFQGPVWYHLAVIVAFTLWGLDVSDFRRTLIVVIAASLWAGVSRVNWVPFPAALAALIYFLEVPENGRGPVRYSAPVLYWGLAGTAAGLGSQYAYTYLSGNPPELFGSSFTSDLLWYRLLPSATFPLGVLPGILLATLPVAAVIYRQVRSKRMSVSAFRWSGIAAILGVFFVGGLLVSVKIGGGSNLHNMDAYLVLLMALAVSVVFKNPSGLKAFPWRIPALAIVIPAAFAVSAGGPFPIIDEAALNAELADLRNLVGSSSEAGGEVLFIAERQLLVFQEIEGVGLVHDYEKVFLMEMAMSRNPVYLETFHRELSDHRFALIVSDVVRYNPQSSTNQFGEENNAWDEFVSAPLLCFYERLVIFPESRVEVLAPVESPGECEAEGPLQAP